LVATRKDGDLSRDHAGTNKNMETDDIKMEPGRANMETGKEKMETATTKIATGNEKMETARAKAASAGARIEGARAALAGPEEGESLVIAPILVGLAGSA